MADESIWHILSQAGIRTRPDFTDPSQWVSATRWQQYGPFKTREAAVGAALRGLIAQLEAAEQEAEAAKNRAWWEKLSGLF